LQAHEKSFLFYLASLTFEFTSKKVQSKQVLAIGIVLNVLTSIIYSSIWCIGRVIKLFKVSIFILYMHS